MRLLALLAVPMLVAAAPVADGLALSGLPEQGGILRGRLPPGAHDLTLDGKPVQLAADGGFLIGFGRDAPAGAVLAWAIGSTMIRRDLAIAARQWDIQSLPNLPPHPVPDAEFEARRPGEIARITAARAETSSETGWRQPFIAPASGRASGVYGSQRILSGTPMAPHSGVDIAARAGSVVVAPAAGVVRLADGPFTLEGNLVMIDHGMGLVSAFLHLSRIDVKPGDHVAKGQPIGLVGQTGRATGPHLHWGVTWTDVHVDPARLLAKPQ